MLPFIVLDFVMKALGIINLKLHVRTVVIIFLKGLAIFLNVNVVKLVFAVENAILITLNKLIQKSVKNAKFVELNTKLKKIEQILLNFVLTFVNRKHFMLSKVLVKTIKIIEKEVDIIGKEPLLTILMNVLYANLKKVCTFIT